MEVRTISGISQLRSGHIRQSTYSGACDRIPQDGDGNKKQTKNDQEGSKNRARDADVSKLALKQTDATDGNKHQTAKPERNAKTMKSTFIRG
jgi:hypothetical protein